MIEGSAVVACPIGANRYVGVWQSVPLTMQDLQGRILRRRRHQQVAEPLRLDVGQRCAASAMRARWWFSAGRADHAILLNVFKTPASALLGRVLKCDDDGGVSQLVNMNI